MILTAKPDWAIHDTLAWLADVEMPTREVHLLDDKWRVACDVYLDDSPIVLPQLIAKRPTATVCRFVRDWNTPLAGASDVHGWDEFENLVAGLRTG